MAKNVKDHEISTFIKDNNDDNFYDLFGGVSNVCYN